MCGRPALLHEAGLLTLSALYGRDLARSGFAQDNDIVPALGLAEMAMDDLQRLAGGRMDGMAPAAGAG